MKRLLLIAGLGVLLLQACVPARQFEDLQNLQKECENNLSELRQKFSQLDNEHKELKELAATIEKRNSQLRNDTAIMGKNYNTLKRTYADLNASYKMLSSNKSKQIAMAAEENRKLLGNLNELETDLQNREDELRKERARLDGLNQELNQSKTALASREQRLNELENIISTKDSLMSSLKNKVSNALLGFKGKGLGIEQKNGRVYVSLDNSLLFASGKWMADEKGKVAINNLAQVLADNPEIQILIEGHTDNVPFGARSEIKDNWDLSVMRATSIVKLLQENKNINPNRFTAAGRGEFVPVASNETKEGKAENRRIEIILTPDLGPLFKLLGQ
jgi:chemotaxis protein MotB